jgi:hypothetical protein
VAENTPVTVNRTERVLAYMLASALGLTILAILAVIIAASAGVDTNVGMWLTLKVFPGVGLTFAVGLIIAIVVVSAIRRTRAARDAAGK